MSQADSHEPWAVYSARHDNIREPRTPKNVSFFELIGTDIITLYIGDELRMVPIYKDILCSKVPYFQNMFPGSFTEASELRAMFPEDDVKVFECLIQWVYTDRIMRLNTPKEYSKLVDTYVLAEKFSVPTLQDIIMNALKAYDTKNDTVPDAAVVWQAYLQTPAGSPLRNYCVRSWRWAITTDYNTDSSAPKLDVSEAMGNQDFAIDFAKQMSNTSGAPSKDPRVFPSCYFHHHGNGGKCLLKGRNNYLPDYVASQKRILSHAV